MTDRDLRPSRFDLSLEYAREFISEWFDQNPLGQIGVVGMRGGLGERLGEMSGMLPIHVVHLKTYSDAGEPVRGSSSPAGSNRARFCTDLGLGPRLQTRPSLAGSSSSRESQV